MHKYNLKKNIVMLCERPMSIITCYNPISRSTFSIVQLPKHLLAHNAFLVKPDHISKFHALLIIVPIHKFLTEKD